MTNIKMSTITFGGEEIFNITDEKSVHFNKAQTLTEEEKKQARTNIGAVSAEEVGKLSEEIVGVQTEISDVLFSKKTVSLLDNAVLGLTSASISKRWFINSIIPKNSKIETISFYCRSTAGGTTYIELWEIENDILTLAKSVPLAVEKSTVNTATVDFYSEKPYIIGFRGDVASLEINTSASDSLGVLSSEDLTSNTLNRTTFGVFLDWEVCAKVEYTISQYNNNLALKKNVITIGDVNCDYEEIQDALDDISDDTENNPYTLMVYPKATPYKRFSMIRKLTDVYPWSVERVRYMSIIGIDKHNTVVQDDNGEYSTPPCEALCNGIIKNMRFICTNDTPLDIPVQGGYACHIDTKPNNGIGYDMTFENCDFVSYQAPAVGIGLHQNANLKFKDCYFENSGDVGYQPNDNYKNIAGYGGVFVHTSTLANVTNQNITFDNCRCITNNGSGLWLSNAGEYNGGMVAKAYGNMFYSKNGSKVTISNDIAIDVTSFGNNAEELNG